MKKSDINSMSDIFQRMLTEAADGGMGAAQSSGGDLYSYGPENLRENKYIDKGGKVLVRFFTKGERIDMSDPASAKKYKAAGAEISYRRQEKEITGKTDFDDLDAFN